MNTTDQLIELIGQSNKMQRKFLKESYNMIDGSSKEELNNYLTFCMSNGLTLQYLADSYNLIVQDTLKEQVYFKKNGRYRYSTYQEVAGRVYLNPDYMSKYMYGLGITSYLWPQHIEYKSFYEKHFPFGKKGNYLEIGPGHGVFFKYALDKASFDEFVGVDISPTSLEMTKSILADKLDSNIELIEADFLEFDSGDRYDAIVMGEVLEHVENPSDFMNKIYSLANDDCFIFITTCVNAPAIDHIQLFRYPSEIEQKFVEANLKIKESKYIPYGNLTYEESMERKLPVNVAYILSR